MRVIIVKSYFNLLYIKIKANIFLKKNAIIKLNMKVMQYLKTNIICLKA